MEQATARANRVLAGPQKAPFSCSRPSLGLKSKERLRSGLNWTLKVIRLPVPGNTGKEGGPGPFGHRNFFRLIHTACLLKWKADDHYSGRTSPASSLRGQDYGVASVGPNPD